MFLLCVLHSKDKGQSQSNQDKETSKGKDEERTRELKKFRWRREFLYSSRLAMVPTKRPVQMVPGLFPGGKPAVAWS